MEFNLFATKVIHRDLKPENLLVQQQDEFKILKLCDFGQATAEAQNMTEYVSTRWYRAPELLSQQKHYSEKIDIWALGCIIAELLTGKPIFPGETNYLTLAYVLKTLGGNLTTEQETAFLKSEAKKVPVIKT